MRRPYGWCLLLILALVGMLVELPCVIGLGMCDCYGSSCINYSTKAEIQQHFWNKEAYNFLYCDDCYQALKPNNYSTPASNQPIVNGTANYWLSEGNRFYLAGSYEQAVAAYAEAVKLNSSISDGWLNMGNALYFLGRYQDSLDAYNAVLKQEPQNANALRGKYQMLLALNRTDEANTTS